MKLTLALSCFAILAFGNFTAAQAQFYDEDARSRDIQAHFDVSDHFGRGRGEHRDAIDRSLQRGADPLQGNFGYTGGFGPYGGYRDGVQHYGTPNYFGQFGGGYYGDGSFPGTWYYQNRRFISPYGGLNRNPSDRYFTR